MISRKYAGLTLLLSTLIAGCGGDDPATTDATSTSASSTGSGSGGAGGGGTGGEGSTSTAASTTGVGGGGTGGGGSMCTTARDQALGPVDSVSKGDVTILKTTGTTRTIYIDASAGGTSMAAQNPWTYLNLATGTKVAVTDPGSFTSTAWDIALKRPLIRANSGDSGPGKGGAMLLTSKAFDTVTAADAAAATIATEVWFDAACNLHTDPTGAIATTFNGWYDYDQATNKLAPHPGTFIVRGGDGKLYKVAFLGYYSNPDGTVGTAGGRYQIEVGPLQ